MQELLPEYFFDLSQFRHKELFDGCELVWDALKRIKSHLADHSLGVIESEVPQTAFLVDSERISIGKGTIVEPGAYIKGPCIIGEDCVIRHGAYIRGDVITGDRCVIGHDTEVKHSIFLNKAQAAHFAYVGDSILGNGINLGAGTKLANLKLDGSHVFLRFQGEKIDTGLRKFGAILGDDCQLGCNSVTSPGTLMGKQGIGYPCVNVKGFVPARGRIKK